MLRLPVPAAARAAAAGPGPRRDRAGLPHGERQLLAAAQGHSVLGWDHCKHRARPAAARSPGGAETNPRMRPSAAAL